MRLCFYGACREVTGSNILLEASGKKILLDCGLFQGYRLAEERNFAPFVYNPAEIDFVVVGHAHLDHTGRLPKLFKEGFRGKIFMTGPTKDLTRLVLEDSEKLMREESQKDNHPALYSRDDINNMLTLCETISYNEKVEISDNISLTFENAGHILGSAITEIEAENKKLIYTSDLGNNPSVLLDPPEMVKAADYVICESTYGGRIHEDISKRREKLAAVINSTVAQNSILMIPSFAIERTQELLHDIEHFCSVTGCERPTFFLDSPLAQKVTAVFSKYPEYLSEKVRESHKDNNFFGLERLKITSSVDESMAIDKQPNPKIIIAGSGMINGGRILHHGLKYFENPKNTLLIVGYQAKGTLGRRIFDGERDITIFGKRIHMNASVASIGSYSAHADLPQLCDWISKIAGCRQVFIVHGEADQSLILSRTIEDKLRIKTDTPQQGECCDL